ncbi:hypothetical protein KCU77_g3517, partial [Aureobasidium melanogenum]
MYHRLLAANAWPGPRLMEHDGNPLLHDVLVALDLLESTDKGRAQPDCHQPGTVEPQPVSPSGDGSIVESPDQQYQLRRNSAPTSSQEAFSQDGFQSRNQSNLSLPLVPEEARWFGGIPELLSRTTTGVHALAPPRRMDFGSATSPASKLQRPTASVQQGTQSLPASFDQQQTFVTAEGSQSAAYDYSSFGDMDVDLFEKPTDWWYAEPGDTAEQQVAMTEESPVNQSGPCELDGLWQSSKDRGIPQVSTDEDDGVDRELPTHFFKVGWWRLDTCGIPVRSKLLHPISGGQGPNTLI